jgi:predicted PurR-regulated permease PerM
VSLFQLGAALIGWFILPVYLGFFLAARVPTRKKAEASLPFLKPETRNSVVFLAAEFVNILVSFFRGQLLIGLLQGILYAIGFTLMGLQYGFVLGLLLGFLNIVPYLGSIIGLAVALPLAFFQTDGGWKLLLLVISVFTVVQLIESYFLTPRIMGKRTGLHPLVIIIAIFFWGSVLGGIVGMILAIPLTAFLVVFWRLLKEKYVKEIV